MSRKVKPEEYMNYDKCIRDDTNTSDAVSREDALTALTGDITGYIIEDYIARTRIRLQNLPPVTPKQRTGKWIKVVTETDSFGNETYHHECSVCKCNKSGWGEYRFCPNCGTKIEGESE